MRLEHSGSSSCLLGAQPSAQPQMGKWMDQGRAIILMVKDPNAWNNHLCINHLHLSRQKLAPRLRSSSMLM